jgi:hypothetical protein
MRSSLDHTRRFPRQLICLTTKDFSEQRDLVRAFCRRGLVDHYRQGRAKQSDPEVSMADYKVDRDLLNSYSTEEILRILEEDKDDYTPEALKVFAHILESRGVHSQAPTDRSSKVGAAVPPRSVLVQENMVVDNASDAVRVLNKLLNGVMDGTIEPQVGQAATNIVMGILRAKEQEFMTEPEEES